MGADRLHPDAQARAISAFERAPPGAARDAASRGWAPRAARRGARSARGSTTMPRERGCSASSSSTARLDRQAGRAPKLNAWPAGDGGPVASTTSCVAGWAAWMRWTVGGERRLAKSRPRPAGRARAAGGRAPRVGRRPPRPAGPRRPRRARARPGDEVVEAASRTVTGELPGTPLHRPGQAECEPRLHPPRSGLGSGVGSRHGRRRDDDRAALRVPGGRNGDAMAACYRARGARPRTRRREARGPEVGAMWRCSPPAGRARRWSCAPTRASGGTGARELDRHLRVRPEDSAGWSKRDSTYRFDADGRSTPSRVDTF
jgi:hypothetical protein